MTRAKENPENDKPSHYQQEAGKSILPPIATREENNLFKQLKNAESTPKSLSNVIVSREGILFGNPDGEASQSKGSSVQEKQTLLAHQDKNAKLKAAEDLKTPPDTLRRLSSSSFH
jgi:hypothetical protein